MGRAGTITPTGPQDAVRLARRLLDSAGPERHDEVGTIWDERAGVAFVVPDDLAWTVLRLVAQVPSEGQAPSDGVAAVDTTSGAAEAVSVVEAPAVTNPAVDPAVVPVTGAASEVGGARTSKRTTRAGTRERASKSSVEFSGG